MPVTDHHAVTIDISPADEGGRRLVTVEPQDGLFVACRSWRTAYPDDLIQLILAVKGPSYLNDEIRRDEDPSYVELSLRNDVFGYVEPARFVGKRLLDFGCGSGASTAIMARTLPDTEITGVELVPELARIAQARIEHYDLLNARVLISPSSQSLPDGIGSFDFVLLSAVWEHLLPPERPVAARLLWGVLKSGGALFLNQTPYRFSPVEAHTTGLPLINYLPRPVVLRLARRFSARVAADESWESLERRGIRGGSEREILGLLPSGASLLSPLAGMDRIDLWYRNSSESTPRLARVKSAMRVGLKAVDRMTGMVLLPSLAVAVRKP